MCVRALSADNFMVIRENTTKYLLEKYLLGLLKIKCGTVLNLLWPFFSGLNVQSQQLNFEGSVLFICSLVCIFVFWSLTLLPYLLRQPSPVVTLSTYKVHFSVDSTWKTYFKLLYKHPNINQEFKCSPLFQTCKFRSDTDSQFKGQPV